MNILARSTLRPGKRPEQRSPLSVLRTDRPVSSSAATASPEDSQRRVNRQLAALALAWMVTRLAVLIGIVVAGHTAWQEVGEYRRWSVGMLAGSFPSGDAAWQYPPGAALVMLLPRVIPLAVYVQVFILIAVVVDGVITLALVRAGESTRSLTPAWIWTAGLPVLLGLPYVRYDIFPTSCAVLALLLIRRRPTVAGAVLGLGISLKLWPGLALIAAPIRTWRSAAAACAGLCLTVAALLRNAFSFLQSQTGRGLEYESIGGSVLLAAKHFGYTGHIEKRYGSYEIVGPWVAVLSDVLLAAIVIALCWLGLWRLRARHTPLPAADAAFTAALLFVTASRVISPQYFIWLLGLAAVCIASRTTTQRPSVILVIASLPLTILEFPIFVGEVLSGRAPIVVILLLRNLMLVVATVWSCRRLWTHAGRHGETAGRVQRRTAGGQPASAAARSARS